MSNPGETVLKNGKNLLDGDGYTIIVPSNGFPPLCACTQVPRGDGYVPAIGSRCSVDHGRPNSVTLTLSGVEASICACLPGGGFTPNTSYKISAVSLDGQHVVDADPAEPCDYLATGVGSVTIEEFDDGDCGNSGGTVQDSDTVGFTISLTGSGLQIYAPTKFGQLWVFLSTFDIPCTCPADTVANTQTACDDAETLIFSSEADIATGGSMTLEPGGGTATTVPDPFPLNDSDWCDLANGVTDPIDDLYRAYDFDIVFQGTLSDSSTVSECISFRVQADSSGCSSPTNKGFWIKTGSITGSITDVTIDDWEMKWTSSGWVLTVDFTDDTDSSTHSITLTRNKPDPYLCSGCWGTSSWQSGFRIGSVYSLQVV